VSFNSLSSIAGIVKAGGVAVVLLGLAYFTFLGIRDRMPARDPVEVDSRDILVWPVDPPEGSPARGEEAARGERPLRIASYNVHECDGTDSRRDPDRVAAVIRSLDADIVSLQEVLSDREGAPSSQLRYLAEKTGMHMAVAGPTMEKKGEHYGNALMSRFPIVNARLHDISCGSFEPRGIIEADILVGDRTVRVVTTHFGLWPTERNRQVRRLLEILPGDPKDPLIVMGDINGWVPGSPVMRRLKAALGRPASLRSFPSRFPLLPLDRIWVLPGTYPFTLEASRSRLARVASDHLPLVCSVILRESNSPSR
jgi:endonuclease/exonuclease/phosphatase family metal-dependent hydrolase